jgi:hypothetical protein
MIPMLLPVIYYLFIVNQISTSWVGPISNENKVNNIYKFITVMLQKKKSLLEININRITNVICVIKIY